MQHASLNYLEKLWLKLFVGGFFILLYTPILVMIVFSFNDSKRLVVWRGATLKYFEKAISNSDLQIAFINSIFIATANMIGSVILGLSAAVFLWRFRFRFKAGLLGVLAMPLVIPEICMGASMLMFFNLLELPHDFPWPLSLVRIIIAHITFSFPFVAVIIGARLVQINREYEHAALDLGASEWQAFWQVLVPQLKPAIISAGLIAFTLSLDDFVITTFTSGPNSITLPVKIFSMLRFSVTPEINAASTILIVVTVIAILLAMKFQASSFKS